MFPKIDKPRHIAKLTKTVAIEICGWKLDDFVLTSEIWINEYDLLCCDKETHGEEEASLVYKKWYPS